METCSMQVGDQINSNRNSIPTVPEYNLTFSLGNPLKRFSRLASKPSKKITDLKNFLSVFHTSFCKVAFYWIETTTKLYFLTQIPRNHPFHVTFSWKLFAVQLYPEPHRHIQRHQIHVHLLPRPQQPLPHQGGVRQLLVRLLFCGSTGETTTISMREKNLIWIHLIGSSEEAVADPELKPVGSGHFCREIQSFHSQEIVSTLPFGSCGAHSLAEEGVGDSCLDKGTDTVVIICTLCLQST